MRFASLVLGAFLVYGLFHYGAQFVAAGLFAPPSDKIAHAGVFGLIAVMLWFVFDRRYPWLVIGLVAITGAADEVHQLFLPGRSAEVADWIADVGGAGLPLLVLMAGRRRTGKDTGVISGGRAETNGLTDEARGVRKNQISVIVTS